MLNLQGLMDRPLEFGPTLLQTVEVRLRLGCALEDVWRDAARPALL